LVKNGVPTDKIRTTNPGTGSSPDVHDSNVDLIISLLSCGFHYPLKTYTEFALRALQPGGIFVFDMRRSEGQENDLAEFASVEALSDHPKHQRVAARKAQNSGTK
jgi:hypothetical protein